MNTLSGDVSVLANESPTDAPCTADCDERDGVALSEMVRGVNVALGSTDIAQCPAADADGDGSVSIDELVDGVANVMSGCGDLSQN
jgi:hypothetical protein